MSEAPAPVHTLTDPDTETEVSLPFQYEWTDRFLWSPVIRSEEYGVGDGLAAPLVVDVFQLATGRPITLRFDRLDRSTVEALYALVSIPAAELTYTDPDGDTRSVQFRGAEPIKAQESLARVPSQSDDTFSATIALIEVA